MDLAGGGLPVSNISSIFLPIHFERLAKNLGLFCKHVKVIHRPDRTSLTGDRER